MGECEAETGASAQRIRGEPPGKTQAKQVQFFSALSDVSRVLSDVSRTRSFLSDVSRRTLAPDAEDTMVGKVPYASESAVTFRVFNIFI